jgi:hypothetical protein
MEETGIFGKPHSVNGVLPDFEPGRETGIVPEVADNGVFKLTHGKIQPVPS